MQARTPGIPGAAQINKKIMTTFLLFISLSIIVTILIIIAGIRTNKIRKETEFIIAHYAKISKMCEEYDRSIAECAIILKSLIDSTEKIKETLKNNEPSTKNKDENINKNN